jgi:hypothetical protein
MNDSRDAIEWEIAITDVGDIDYFCLVTEAQGSQVVPELGNCAATGSPVETMRS